MGKMEQSQITRDMKRLLYLVSAYTNKDGKYGKSVIKDLPIRGLIFKGVLEKIFDYDYAPTSVFYIDNRRYINVSQEGEDDLNDLRELGLLKKIRLATRRHFYIYCYGLTKKGVNFLHEISAEDRAAVDQLIKCDCGKIFDVLVKEAGIFMKCDCGNMLNTQITEIEDVSYVCEPIKIVTTLTKRAKLGLCLMTDDESEIIPKPNDVIKTTITPKVVETPQPPKQESIQPSQPKSQDEWWKKQEYIDSSKLKKGDER